MSKKKIIMFICGFLVVICIGMLSYFRIDLREETFVAEIGSSLDQDAVTYAKGYTSGASVDLSKVDTEQVGTYKATVKGKFQTLNFNVDVKDTEAPTAVAIKDQSFSTNESVLAKSLVSNVSDASSVIITFEDGSDSLNLTEGGEYSETILLTDSSGNQSSVTVKFGVIDDTTKPVLLGVADFTIYIGDTINYLKKVTASDDTDGDLTEAIQVDNTSVKIDTPGEYKVTYSVCDKSGNQALKNAKVVVKEDKAPVLNGISDKTIYIGTNVNYLDGVTATDDKDGNLTSKIKVSSSEVNTSKKGSYKVVYSVTDSSGNKTKKSIVINVKAKETTAKSTSTASSKEKNSSKEKESSNGSKENDSSNSSKDKNTSNDSGSNSGFQFFDVEPSGPDVDGDVAASGEHVGSWE